MSDRALILILIVVCVVVGALGYWGGFQDGRKQTAASAPVAPPERFVIVDGETGSGWGTDGVVTFHDRVTGREIFCFLYFQRAASCVVLPEAAK